MVVGASLGCDRGGGVQQESSQGVSYVGGKEVERLVTSSREPILLEFCVPAGCFRCDEMRPSIDALAKERADRLAIRRVDLNTDRQLAAQWGIKVCPTYLAFVGGREVGRLEYPTSADLVSSMIPH